MADAEQPKATQPPEPPPKKGLRAWFEKHGDKMLGGCLGVCWYLFIALIIFDIIRLIILVVKWLYKLFF